MPNKTIVFITNSYFPSGQAYSKRALNLSRTFRECGYSVKIIADCTKEHLENGQGIYDGFEYFIVGDNSKAGRYLKNKRNSLALLKRITETENVSAILISGGTYDRFVEVFKLSRQKGIPLLLEICEWYDIKSFKLGELDLRYRKFNSCMNSSYKKADGIIAISRYLEDYFFEYNSNVIRIPSLAGREDFVKGEKTESEKIVLIHAGTSVGKQHKEMFKAILQALASFGDNCPFEYRIFGSDRKTILENIDFDEELINSLGDSVKIFGKIPQSEVLKQYLQADYSIFVRPDRRSSHAGFPTKLSESLCAGTPVIANNTGDIGLYLKDGENGFIIKDGTETSVRSVLDRILAVDGVRRAEMRICARETAEKSFLYTEYIDSVKELLDKTV